MKFWEDYFTDKMTSLFKSKFGGNTPSEDILQDLVFNVLRNHILELIENWKIKLDVLIEHTNKLGKENNLQQPKLDKIMV